MAGEFETAAKKAEGATEEDETDEEGGEGDVGGTNDSDLRLGVLNQMEEADGEVVQQQLPRQDDEEAQETTSESDEVGFQLQATCN